MTRNQILTRLAIFAVLLVVGLLEGTGIATTLLLIGIILAIEATAYSLRSIHGIVNVLLSHHVSEIESDRDRDGNQ